MSSAADEPVGSAGQTEPDDAGRPGARAGHPRQPERIGCSLTGFHNSLARAYQAGRAGLRRRGAELGLGPGQPKLLVYLTVHGPTGQRELADYFDTDPAAISRMTDALVRSGFVTSAPGRDRRTRVLAATESGRTAAEAWDRSCAQEEEIMLAGFTAKERAAFVGYLMRVRANLHAAGGTGRTAMSGRASGMDAAPGSANSSDVPRSAQDAHDREAAR